MHVYLPGRHTHQISLVQRVPTFLMHLLHNHLFNCLERLFFNQWFSSGWLWTSRNSPWMSPRWSEARCANQRAGRSGTQRKKGGGSSLDLWDLQMAWRFNLQGALQMMFVCYVFWRGHLLIHHPNYDSQWFKSHLVAGSWSNLTHHESQ